MNAGIPMRAFKWNRLLCLLLVYQLAFVVAAQTLVLPGDHPDPSVVKIGDSYWASATTSNWAPAFPLLQSKDLIHWQQQACVFPKLPAWADYYFWAPEITYDNGKVYVYYAAHKKDGNLCVGVASAATPKGPYTDHGTLICEAAGSIDAFPMRDENGKLFLIWKEDGNSIRQPTPIWAMAMNEERTALTGEKKELFRNDASWEANLVEGVSMIKHGGYFYAFYAGAGCCGRSCSYAMGIARAKNLLGPWEKYDKNPLFTGGDRWKCPGHGTPIEKNGKYYLLYHAYDVKGDVYAGRQGVLKEFTFTADGWIALAKDEVEKPRVTARLSDDFSGTALSPHWQWSVFKEVNYKVKTGRLELSAQPDKAGAYLGQKTFNADYDATVTVFPTPLGAAGGIALVGDENNLVSLVLKNNTLIISKLESNRQTIIVEKAIEKTDKINLRMSVRNGKDINFMYNTNGKDFSRLNDKSIDGTYLPPWDRALRVALVSQGESDTKAVFDDFVLDNR